MCKEQVLMNICDWFEFEVVYEQEKLVMISCWGKEYDHVYDSIDNALIDWLNTLEEADDYAKKYDNEAKYWDEEIKFIKSLQKQETFPTIGHII